MTDGHIYKTEINKLKKTFQLCEKYFEPNEVGLTKACQATDRADVAKILLIIGDH